MAPVAEVQSQFAAAPTPVPTKAAANIPKANEAVANTESYPRAPLQLSGILDQYEHFDVTPVIGREFPTVQLKDLINAPNADDLLRELAIISECRNCASLALDCR